MKNFFDTYFIIWLLKFKPYELLNYSRIFDNIKKIWYIDIFIR